MSQTWDPGDPHDPRNPENRQWVRGRQAELRELLLVWDPIGVGDLTEARDEYDCMISPLMQRLHDGADHRQISSWLSRELEEHFGLPSQAPRESSFAATLVTWWRLATVPEG